MNDNSSQNTSPSPEELVSLGEQIYFSKKEKLEKTSLGKFAVIEVDSKDIIINSDKLAAIEEARAKYPNKLFYIVQIGNLKQQSTSELNEIKKYGWTF